MKVEEAAGRLEALGNATRLQVYRLLVRAGPEGLPVGAVQDRLRMPASTLSHHLRRLIEADLIRQERRGTTLQCRANFQTMNAVLGYLFDECCADSRCAPSAKRNRQRS